MLYRLLRTEARQVAEADDAFHKRMAVAEDAFRNETPRG